jgi:hypothetical protein
LTGLQKVLTTGASFSALSSLRFKLVVIYEVTIRGAYDLPDHFLIWIVLDLINKIIVRSRARWRIGNDPTCTIIPSPVTVRPSLPNPCQKYHRWPSPRNLSSSTTGIKTWRRARFGFISPRFMSRLSEAGAMFRYSACLILSARGLVWAQLGDIFTYLIYIPERTLVK